MKKVPVKGSVPMSKVPKPQAPKLPMSKMGGATKGRMGKKGC